MDADPNARFFRSHTLRNAAMATATIAGASAAIVAASAHRTELAHPAAGRFIDVSGPEFTIWKRAAARHSYSSMETR